MLSQIGTDTLNQLHSDNEEYIYAVASIASVMLTRINDMVQEMVEGDSFRLADYLLSVTTSADDFDGALQNDDFRSLDFISEELVPAVSTLHNIDPEDVAADVSVMVDFLVSLYK